MMQFPLEKLFRCDSVDPDFNLHMSICESYLVENGGRIRKEKERGKKTKKGMAADSEHQDRGEAQE